jgi:hypothetical protein
MTPVADKKDGRVLISFEWHNSKEKRFLGRRIGFGMTIFRFFSPTPAEFTKPRGPKAKTTQAEACTVDSICH